MPTVHKAEHHSGGCDPSSSCQPAAQTWAGELDDALRALSGAFLFGIPLLYTMEVWWKGNFTGPPRMLATLATTFMALLILNYVAGFRRSQSFQLSRVFMDSTVGLALALIASAFSLAVIGVLSFDMGLETMLGHIIMEAVPFGIGAGISNFLIEGHRVWSNNKAGANGHSNPTQQEGLFHGTLIDAGASVLGATVIAFSIAPTDEVIMIASHLSSPRLLVLIGTSLLLSYIIVFESSFGSERRRKEQKGIFQHPFSETVFSYLLSLGMSILMLWLFQLLGPDDPFATWVTFTLVLGLPASIGGAAGRIAI